jgi:hypothetical protein
MVDLIAATSSAAQTLALSQDDKALIGSPNECGKPLPFWRRKAKAGFGGPAPSVFGSQYALLHTVSDQPV